MQPQILRRVIALTEKTRGFTVDGKPLLALCICEKLGKDYLVHVNSSNLARLTEQNYYLTIAGSTEETLRLALQSTSPMRIHGRMNADIGLGVLLWTERESTPIPVAFGVSGRVASLHERIKGEVLRVLHSPVYREGKDLAEKQREGAYEDEAIATENYYAVKEKQDEENGCNSRENVIFKGENCQEKQGENPHLYPKTDENAAFGQENLTFLLGDNAERDFGGNLAEKPLPESIQNAFFNRKKRVILQTLTEGERERALCNAVPGSYFVKLPSHPLIFGVITLKDCLSSEDLPNLTLSDVITLCYALPTDSPTVQTGKEYRYFVPVKTDNGRKGYLVTCQNPVSGNPEQISFT